MNVFRLILAIAAIILSGCGNDGPVKCKGATDYLEARPAPRIKSPGDLDDLDELREMPIPEASPQAPGMVEGGCLDSPPVIVGT